MKTYCAMHYDVADQKKKALTWSSGEYSRRHWARGRPLVGWRCHPCGVCPRHRRRALHGCTLQLTRSALSARIRMRALRFWRFSHHASGTRANPVINQSCAPCSLRFPAPYSGFHTEVCSHANSRSANQIGSLVCSKTESGSFLLFCTVNTCKRLEMERRCVFNINMVHPATAFGISRESLKFPTDRVCFEFN